MVSYERLREALSEVCTQRDEARAETARWVERVRVLEARLDAVRRVAQ